jgi:outer membrane protein assembly factor BamA
MRRNSQICRGAVVACALIAPLASAQAPQPAAPEALATLRTRLEESGATIRSIRITVENVFDPNNPEENKRLYRWANNVHVPTRESVIEDILLFSVGDPFVARVLDESARAIRARGFIAEATVEPGSYDAATNSVDVEVHVRDSWSLQLDLKLTHTGGETEWGIGLSEGNLFGTGKTLEIGHESEIDRDETRVGYGDGNVFGSRVRLRALLTHASDGHRRELDVSRPFYALATRWSVGGRVFSQERVDTMYDLGEEIDRFAHDLEAFEVGGGWSYGMGERTAARWLVGVAGDQHRFSPTPELPGPLLLPPDRELVYPWIGWQRVEDDYREMSELNDMGRTEDISLGFNVYGSVGFAKESYGSDRDATLYRVALEKGWEPGGPGRLLVLEGGASTRDETTGLQNSQVYFSGHYYRRNLEKHLFSVSLNALATNNLDPENQVLLGGDNGLRGYPIRYQAGENRVVLNVEQRFFTDWYPWRLLRVGWAVFADAGRVTGQDPRATPPLGLLRDVGIGLRLTSPRAAGNRVVHIDLAFPLDGDESIDSVQFVVETKRSF